MTNFKKYFYGMAMAMMMFFASTLMVSADDGVTSSVEETGFSFEMPAEEAPVVDEPVVEEPTPEPQPEVVEEPAPEPQPEPVVVEEQHDEQPAPAPQPQPSNNDGNNDNNDSQPEQVVEPVVETPVVEVQNVETPVVETVAETPIATQTTSSSRRNVVRAAAPTTTAVLGVNRVNKVVPEDIDGVATEDEFQDDEKVSLGLIIALILALLAFIGIALYLLGLGRKYEVVLRETDENGEQETTSLKKFFNAEKAAEYIRDYLYDNQDSDYVLNLYNNSRDGEEELEDGSKIQKDFVYYVSADRSAEMILWADDDEVDAIERILGFVCVEA